MRRATALLLLMFSLAAGARGEVIAVGPGEFRDPKLWERVKGLLGSGPVEVVLGAGEYGGVKAVRITGVGDEGHGLVLRADGEVTFRDPPGDKQDRNTLLVLDRCRNVTVRGLRFEGGGGLGSALVLQNCVNARVEGCGFEGLTGAYYSAMSVTGERTDGVVVRGCTFKRVGLDSHAHMIYSAYGVRRLSVVDCTFEDCSGDFVRFRDETDFGVVFGCSFTSTGTYRNANPPMISVPLFNDDDPAAKKASPNYEYFGTHFVFANNRMTYADAGRRETRFAVVFHHSGFNPPGRTHLFTEEEAARVAKGTPADRKAALKELTGIDLDRVHVYGNEYSGVETEVAYRSNSAYGAKSRGWKGVIDLTGLANDDAVVSDSDAAERYWAGK